MPLLVMIGAVLKISFVYLGGELLHELSLHIIYLLF